MFIWNDGEIPNNWTIETLSITHGSKPRNPDIFNTFFRAGMVESWGRGISKILEECAKAEVPTPFFELTMGGVDVRFLPKIQESVVDILEKTTQKTTQKIRDKILEIIRESPTIGRKEMAKILGEITEDGVKYHLDKLKAENKIERIGADKGGYWQIIIK